MEHQDVKVLYDPEFRPKWSQRRRIINVSLIFCSVMIFSIVLYIMSYPFIGGPLDFIPIDFFTAALWAFLGAAISIIGSYVFGAAYDDKNVLNTLVQFKQKDR